MKSIIVIGGGIVGLAAAREITLRRPGTKVLLLEKENRIAAHQTGHNSGVIHSGIYYAPGSAKALTCLEGGRLLAEFCDRHGIERRPCGKVIVATRPEELPGIEKLYQQGVANQVKGLRKISRDELREVEPAVSGLAALHLSEVRLVDFRKVSEALKKELEQSGGSVRLLQKVRAIRFTSNEVLVQTNRETYSGDYLVNCAGLYSDVVARRAGLEVPIRIIPFRGEYFTLAPEKTRQIRGLVYPVPDSRFPFLGVHLTPTLDGKVTVGPNAVLALAREGYSWFQINPGEMADYLTYNGFWRMTMKYWKMGLYELVRSLMKPVYAKSAGAFLPGLKSSDLQAGGSGVRAQAVNSKGEFIQDFLHFQQPHALHILNAPSPAATASLAIARRIADLLPS